MKLTEQCGCYDAMQAIVLILHRLVSACDTVSGRWKETETRKERSTVKLAMMKERRQDGKTGSGFQNDERAKEHGADVG